MCLSVGAFVFAECFPHVCVAFRVQYPITYKLLLVCSVHTLASVSLFVTCLKEVTMANFGIWPVDLFRVFRRRRPAAVAVRGLPRRCVTKPVSIQ